jgi:hypothetical protein
MRNLILAAAAVAGLSALASSPAAAASYPYCMTSEAYGTDCSYPTYAACQATASGLGYDCIVNPAAAYDPRPYSETRRARRNYSY